MKFRTGLGLIGTSVFIVTLAAAGSTEFVSTWRNPLAGPLAKPGQKAAAFVITAEESMRLGPEESLADLMRARGLDCVAGYTVLPGELAKDQQKAKEFLVKGGITSVIIMRVLGEQEGQEAYGTGAAIYSAPHYASLWNYWGYSWGVVYTTETKSDKVFSVETLVYSIEQDKLIWGGISETTNPKDIQKFIKDLVNAAGKEMRKAGLLHE